MSHHGATFLVSISHIPTAPASIHTSLPVLISVYLSQANLTLSTDVNASITNRSVSSLAKSQE